MFRLGKKMRQDDLAAALGVTQSMICQYENDSKIPTPEMADRMAAIFECDASELVDGFELRKEKLLRCWRKLSTSEMDTLINFAQFMAERGIVKNYHQQSHAEIAGIIESVVVSYGIHGKANRERNKELLMKCVAQLRQ